MRGDRKRIRPSRHLSRPPFRALFMEGVTAFAPAPFIVAVGIASGLLLAPLGLPVWFGASCLFTDRLQWPVDLAACEPFPPFDDSAWALALVWLALVGVAYLALFRISVQRGWLVSAGSIRLHPGHALGMAAAVITGILFAAVSATPAVTGAERLVMVVTGPLWLRIWWSVRLKAYTLLADRVPEQASAWTFRILLARQFGVAVANVRVEAPASDADSTGRAALAVTGPFDAVDARRIADLVDTRMCELVASVETHTTLPEDEYWRPLVEELGPSGYVSPPIPAPMSIPSPLLWGFLGFVALAYGFLVSAGDPLSVREVYLQRAAESISHDLEQLEAGLDPTKETGVDVSFYLINLRDSKDACPSLGREAMRRWRLREERHDDRYVYRVHQVSEVDFYGYVVDGVARTCAREEFGRSLREAQYRVASHFMPYEWDEIDSGLDWRYVPPRPDIVR